MQKLSLIQDFRKLEEKLGKEPSDLLLKILDQREVMLLDKLATKEDLYSLRMEFQDLKTEFAHLEKRVEAKMVRIEAKIGSMAWKMAGLLILQAGVIVALIKLI